MRENLQKPTKEDLFPGGLPQEHSGLFAGSRYVYSCIKKRKKNGVEGCAASFFYVL